MGGSGGKGGKTKIYESVQIDSIFPDRKNIFRKKMLSYKSQTRSNKEVIKKLIKDKANFTAIKKLKKFGFIKDFNGEHSYLTKTGLELYIAQITHETDINVKYKVGIKYKHILGRIIKEPYYNRTTHEWVNFEEVLSVWTTSTSHPSCTDVGYKEIVCCNIHMRDVCDSIDQTNGDIDFSKTLTWRSAVEYKLPTYKDLTYETLEFIDWKIQQWLENTYKSDTSISINVYKSVIENRGIINVTYHKYNIKDDKWYKPIIDSGSIKRRYDTTNNVLFISLINVDDSDDIIEIEWPIDDSLLCAVIYTSAQNRHEHVFVDYYDKMLINATKLHFFTIPVKHNGSMIKYDNDALKVWLKQIGISLPDKLGSKDLKDVIFTLLTKYNISKYPILDKYIKFIYGDYEEQRSVSIDTGAGTVSYRWKVNNEGDIPKIIRSVAINGYKYMDVLDTTLNNIHIHHNYENNYNCCWSHKMGKNTYDTKEKSPTYIIPIEGLRKMSLPDFFDIYYATLHSVTYAKKEVHQKWYQTELFSFLLTITIVVVAVMTGHPEVAMMVIASYTATKLLVIMGVDPTVAAIIVAVVSFGVSMYNAGAQIATTEASTTSTIGADINTAGSISMSGASASTSIGTTISNTASQIWQGIQNSFTISWANAANFMNTSNQVLGIYSAIKNYQNQKELEDLQKDIKDINSQADKISKKLDEVFKNSFNWYPRAEFDIQYNMIYSDPISNQIALDSALYDAPFDIINKTLN